jgi:hypothetical protein
MTKEQAEARISIYDEIATFLDCVICTDGMTTEEKKQRELVLKRIRKSANRLYEKYVL